MRSLYDINTDILALVDEETGEFDEAAYEALALERELKIESLCLWCKDLKASAAAIREEEKALAARRKAEENKLESVERYIQYVLDGASFKTSKCAVSYRLSEAVEIMPEKCEAIIDKLRSDGHNGVIIQKPAEINKNNLKALLKAGYELDGAEIVVRQNMSIK